MGGMNAPACWIDECLSGHLEPAVDPASVPCPRCGVDVGEDCKRLSRNSSKPMPGCHGPRRRDAQALRAMRIALA
jgi:hypothetical protein